MKNEDKMVFKTADEKVMQFQTELQQLLFKFNAELCIEDFGPSWVPDEKIVVNFAFDEALFHSEGSGIVPDLVIGKWLDGKC
jgi:hypothetical protein